MATLPEPRQDGLCADCASEETRDPQLRFCDICFLKRLATEASRPPQFRDFQGRILDNQPRTEEKNDDS